MLFYERVEALAEMRAGGNWDGMSELLKKEYPNVSTDAVNYVVTTLYMVNIPKEGWENRVFCRNLLLGLTP